MDSAIIGMGGTVQLVGLALVALMVIILGMRIVGSGARGFASLLGEVGALLIALYIVARPNDVTSMLLKAVGGVQTLGAIH